MELEIKTYQPEYLQAQVELGEEIRQDWPMGSQTPLKKLEIIYKRDSFDPSANYYAFVDNNLVGYVTTTIFDATASLDFPIVKDNDGEIGKELLEYALQDLKEKGITTVTAKASPVWGKTEVYARGYGFEAESVEVAQGHRLVRLLPDVEQDPTINLDINEDEGIIRQIFEQKLEYSDNHVDYYLDMLKNDPELVLDWSVLAEQKLVDEIKGHVVVVNEPKGSEEAYLVHLYMDSSVDITSFVNVVLSHLDQDQLEYINVILSQDQTDWISDFEELGFKFTKITNYQLNL